MSASNISVRAARTADETFCRAMDNDLAHLQTFHADFAMLVRMRTALVASVMDRPAGYLRLERLFLKIPYISCIKVLPEFRNQGVGKLLLQEMVKQESILGASYILSSSERRASEAIAWHKKNAFYEIGALDHMNQDGATEVFFRLDIAQPR